jgi:hypothetical protein
MFEHTSVVLSYEETPRFTLSEKNTLWNVFGVVMCVLLSVKLEWHRRQLWPYVVACFTCGDTASLYAYPVPEVLSAGGGGWPWQFEHAPVAPEKDSPFESLCLWHDSQSEFTPWVPPEWRFGVERNVARGM